MLVWYEIVFSFFFFNDTATTEIYTLSLHDALPICGGAERVDHDERRERGVVGPAEPVADGGGAEMGHRDRLCVHDLPGVRTGARQVGWSRGVPASVVSRSPPVNLPNGTGEPGWRRASDEDAASGAGVGGLGGQQ